MMDEQARYVRWNKKVEAFMGYPASEMLNRSVGLRVSLEDRPKVDEAIREGFRKGHASLEYGFLTTDGRKVPYYASGRRVTIEGTDYLVGVAIDISSRKESEAALLKAFAEISQLKERLRAECTYLQEEIKLQHDFENIVGESDALKYVLFKIEQVAPTDTTVLILGETGTGKELVARAIHSASKRKDRPLVKVDCAALPSNLIESELFGHEQGSFTGAHDRRLGRFELANGGTIFLDEIGELPLALQSKLLRVIQEGEFERLGSSRTIKVDVRVIAATNRHLEQEVQSRNFRQDLWYRLNVFPISLPPLRVRKEDVPSLVRHFVARCAKKVGKPIERVPQAVMGTLVEYDWPGNIRELQNVIERAVICSEGDVLRLAERLPVSERGTALPSDPSIPCESVGSAVDFRKRLLAAERQYTVSVLEEHKWKIEGEDGAAEALGLHPSTLRGRMRRLGIRRHDPPSGPRG
ncbi:MAG: sigma 54-interacting transcriptional regulator [Gemmatimonadetes bacterium]|nr:sigma 54-interacting transcriptional regulator [Gemmatimonadota bacterium]